MKGKSDKSTLIASELFIFSLLNIVNVHFLSALFAFSEPFSAVDTYIKSYTWADNFALAFPVIIGIFMIVYKYYSNKANGMYYIFSIAILSIITIRYLVLEVLNQLSARNADISYFDWQQNGQAFHIYVVDQFFIYYFVVLAILIPLWLLLCKTHKTLDNYLQKN